MIKCVIDLNYKNIIYGGLLGYILRYKKLQIFLVCCSINHFIKEMIYMRKVSEKMRIVIYW